ncbi:hypothetical protein OIU84_016225 [Salix udensis]|uniref:pyridoxal 5'-phosphate synthase n=1 Tax=Salix udensis TaxID=889485 RepID=A0AAD6J8Y9_9ROSI|nr:hypothetical protein OIU84_016225 [Salix udensis]
MGTATPWKLLLLSALESNSHLKHSTYFQFATIGCNGRPSNRSVVFRGFGENSDRIQINTDCRTLKNLSIVHLPRYVGILLTLGSNSGSVEESML